MNLKSSLALFLFFMCLMCNQNVLLIFLKAVHFFVVTFKLRMFNRYTALLRFRATRILALEIFDPKLSKSAHFKILLALN